MIAIYSSLEDEEVDNEEYTEDPENIDIDTDR